MSRLLFISILILLGAKVNAQGPLPCGKPKINMEALKIAEAYMARTQQPTAVNRLVRVYFHIFKDNDGTNAAATLAQVQNEFNQLVADYAPNSLCFAYMGIDSINNTMINNSLNPDVPSNVAWLNPFLIPGCINIFYHAGLIGYGGNAFAIPNTFCSIGRGNLNLWRTTSHEVGHCMGLNHTFETAFGLENINGNNCGTAGDRVCDTPADPWSFRGSNACFSNVGCSYGGTCTDGNGSNLYNPPFTNIMSYWGVVGCNLTLFSGGQYSRVNGFLDTNAGLMATTSDFSGYYGPATVSSGVIMRSSITLLSTTGTVILTGSVNASFQARSVTINAGFRATPTSGRIIIRPANCNY
ncbi:MAG: M43 family zinc metalloprotease [Ferruginibacter sp.]